MRALTTDDPIPSDPYDQLDRAPFADFLRDAICAMPSDQSLRIGLYGEWGDGKTSVLKLLEGRLQTKQVRVVWISPWAVNSSEDFVVRLIEKLAVELGVSDKRVRKSEMNRRKLDELTTIGNRYHLAWQLATVAFGDRLQRVADRVAKGERDQLMVTILARLHDQRVVVFVDDLDRARPEVLPDFLLAIRDVFGFTNIVYVLALSPRTVQVGLQAVHGGWGSVETFLEKIIEFPTYLPSPSAEARTRLARSQIELSGGSFDHEVLSSLTPVLPENPRRLKLFVRQMGALGGLTSRFGPGELNLRCFALCQMLQLEFPTATRSLRADVDAMRGMSSWYLRSTSNTAKRPESSPEQQFAPTVGGSRFLRLCAEIREAVGYGSEYSLEDLFALPHSSPYVTKKEIRELFDDVRGLSDQVVLHRIEAVIRSYDVRDTNRASALFVRAVELREQFVDAVVEHEHERDARKAIADVSDCSRLIRLMQDQLRFVADALIELQVWWKLVEHAIRWSHWVSPDWYTPMRQEELSLVQAGLAALSGPQRLEALAKWPREEFGPARARMGAQFAAMLDQVRSTFEASAVDALNAAFRRAEAIRSILTEFDGGTLKGYLVDPDSPFHAEAERRALARIAAEASSSDAIHDNCFFYLYYLFVGAFSEASTLNREAALRLLGDREFVSILWGAAMTNPLGRRHMGSILAYRKYLVTREPTLEGVLPVPRWATALDLPDISPPIDPEPPTTVC